MDTLDENGESNNGNSQENGSDALNSKQKRKKKRLFLKELKYLPTLPPISTSKAASASTTSILSNDTDWSAFPKPFSYCRFVTKFPVISFLIAFSLHLTTLGVTLGLFFTGYDIFPIDFGGLPLNIIEDEQYRRSHAFSLRSTIPNFLPRVTDNGPNVGFDSRQLLGDVLEVIFKVSDGDIYSRENLQRLKNAENKLFNTEGFKEFCLIGNNGTCSKPLSILRFFDGTSQNFLSLNFENISTILCTAYTDRNTSSEIRLFMEVGFNPCNFGSRSSLTRIFLNYGGHRKEDRDNFQGGAMRNQIHQIRDVDLNGIMTIYYLSNHLILNDLQIQSLKDMYLGIGSALFIIMVMWIQTASLWITIMGLYSIVTSYLIANLIYRYCFGYMYFGFFHMAAMFIIFGIGADDVFVFYDTWRLTRHKTFPSTAHRLSEFYRKAAKTTFITSLTTTIAFLSTCWSPILPVRTFGIFSALLVSVNYLFDLIYFPTSVIMYTEKIEPFCAKIYTYCCPNVRDCFTRISNLCRMKNKLPKENENRNDVEVTSSAKNRNFVVVFFTSIFYRFVTWKPIKIGLPILFLGTSILFIIFASKLETDAEYVQLFVSTHQYDVAYRMHHRSFQRKLDSDYTDVHLLWGVKLQDISICNLKSSEKCYGESRFDDNIELSDVEVQIAMQNLCTRLKTLTEEEINKLRIQINSKTGLHDIDCFMADFETFLQTEETRARYDGNVSLFIPIEKTSMTQFMAANPAIYSKPLPTNFTRWFEIAVDYWLTNGYTGTISDDYTKYNLLLGRIKIENETQVVYRGQIPHFYGTKLGFVAVRIGTTIDSEALSYTDGQPVYQAWETFMDEELKKMPKNMQNGFQLTLIAWQWIVIQKVLVDYAVNALIIGLFVALPILIITSMNILIGVIATVVIGLIITCVIGLMQLAGFKLGVLESLNLSMVVGLSIDYVVHLAEAYRSAHVADRNGRVKIMLESMGLSVSSGALTTFGAASFMLGSQNQFIYQFGVFVMSIIAISFVYSLFGFTKFMALCGPQGDTGSLKVICRKISKLISKNREVKAPSNIDETGDNVECSNITNGSVEMPSSSTLTAETIKQDSLNHM